MRLLSLELVDFQAHEKTVVEFSPTLTTIVGPTDIGKSAVLRALRWVCLNDIAGDEFIKEGQKKTTVTLCVTEKGFDEKEIVRTKSHTSTGLNTYQLDGEEYKAFGVTVPADIASLLQLNEINFQGQHDSPFWFNETAGEVSRRLNAVVDLSVIDTALANIASEVRQAQERKTFTEERLSTAQLDLEKLEPQQKRIEEFKALKEVHEEHSKVNENCDRLESAIQKYCSNRDRTKELEEKSIEGSGVLAAAQTALDSAGQMESLRNILSDVSRYQAKAEPPPNFGPVEAAFEEWRGRVEKAGRLDRIVWSTKEATLLVDGRSKAAKAIEEEFHSQMKGKECPLCQKIIE